MAISIPTDGFVMLQHAQFAQRALSPPLNSRRTRVDQFICAAVVPQACSVPRRPRRRVEIVQVPSGIPTAFSEPGTSASTTDLVRAIQNIKLRRPKTPATSATVSVTTGSTPAARVSSERGRGVAERRR